MNPFLYSHCKKFCVTWFVNVIFICFNSNDIVPLKNKKNKKKELVCYHSKRKVKISIQKFPFFKLENDNFNLQSEKNQRLMKSQHLQKVSENGKKVGWKATERKKKKVQKAKFHMVGRKWCSLSIYTHIMDQTIRTTVEDERAWALHGCIQQLNSTHLLEHVDLRRTAINQNIFHFHIAYWFMFVITWYSHAHVKLGPPIYM